MDATNNNVTPDFDRDLLDDVYYDYANICRSIIQQQMTTGPANIFRIFNFNPDPAAPPPHPAMRRWIVDRIDWDALLVLLRQSRSVTA